MSTQRWCIANHNMNGSCICPTSVHNGKSKIISVICHHSSDQFSRRKSNQSLSQIYSKLPNMKRNEISCDSIGITVDFYSI